MVEPASAIDMIKDSIKKGGRKRKTKRKPKKRKTRTKRGAGPDPNLTDWKSGKPMTYCQDRERAKYRLCNNVCGSKAKGVQNKKGVPSKKKMEQCNIQHRVQKGNVVLPVSASPTADQVRKPTRILLIATPQKNVNRWQLRQKRML